MQDDSIISALIGLIGACNHNPKTANTDAVVIKALAFPPPGSACDEAAVQQMIDEIHAEKNAVAPGCALCAAPCGSTSDYDMTRIYQAAEDIREAKTDILSELRKAACAVCRRPGAELPHTVDCEFFYKALSLVSYDMDQKALLSLLAEAQEINHKIEEELS